MGDVVGLIASVIAIAQVVTEGVKHAKTFFQAQKELEALQARVFSEDPLVIGVSLKYYPEQLEHFTNLIKEIHSQHTMSSSAVITASVLRAKLTMEQLNQLIHIKILKNVDGTARARRRAWTRNKSKLYRLQDVLKEHRENFAAALTANSL
ncbi:hypothetical protein MMC17_008710 [Xylographa soralifera]|nr:hypothetical protein [Xylographa soralifera]